MSVQLAQLGITASAARRIPPTPLYATLSNVELILDATGIRPGTSNVYGVASGDTVTQWNSIAPGPTGRNFSVAGTGQAFQLTDGFISFAGAASLRNNTAANWNFMHYNATFANLKWTVHMVCKVGNEASPNMLYAFFGNNGFSAGNKGVTSAYDNRPWQPKTQGTRSIISKGTAGFISDASPDNIITPNVPFVYTIEFDGSQVAADRFKEYINGVQFAFTTSSPSTAVVTTPTYDLEFGAAGNSTFGFFGWMSHVIIQSGVESGGVRTAFINSLIPFTIGKSSQYWSVDQALRYTTINTLAEAGIYYLATGFNQKPTSSTTILKYTIRGTKHTDDDTKKIVLYKSTDRGGSFAAAVDIYDPASTLAVQDMGGGYSANGRHHIICDTHDVSGGVYVAPHAVQYLYSDDDYATAATMTALTIPSDGLSGIRCHGKMIENNGVLMKPFYKYTDENTFTNSANYIYRSTDGGANWSVITVRSSASTYINEMTIAALSSTHVIIIARNESTNEYTFFHSTDNGATWNSDGDFTPEALSIAAPGTLTTFMAEGQLIVQFTYPVKSAKTIKAIYGTAASIISSNQSGFIAGSLITLVTNAEATNQIYHYFDICHFKNDFNCEAAGSREPVTVTLTENNHLTWYFPSSGYLTVKTALGI